MKRKELKILGLSYSTTQIGSYVCVLVEKRGGRKIPIIIKAPEAQKIALEIEGIKSNRPLTHDLIKGLCDTFDLDVQEAFIHSLLEGVFYARIIVSNGLDEYELECGVGDALAIATLFKCPIFTTGEIIDTVGIMINDDGTPSDEQYAEEDYIDEEDCEDDENDLFESLVDDGKKRIISVEDLEKLMQEAIENEEYEIAAEIRDRIQKLRGQDENL